MSDKNAKDIRKQVRNVAQELLEPILKDELMKSVSSDLKTEMRAKLIEIQKEVQDKLIEIDERSKNVQTFILNQIQAELAKTPATPTKPE